MTDPFKDTIATWPAEARRSFGRMRALILAAGAQADVGPLTESLKWGQPAWRPTRPKQGSTLRLNWTEKSPSTLVLHVDCKTTLATTMREIYPTEFRYESNRALHLDIGARWPVQAIDHLARLTFRYHLKD
jgi:hypothetical protein